MAANVPLRALSADEARAIAEAAAAKFTDGDPSSKGSPSIHVPFGQRLADDVRQRSFQAWRWLEEPVSRTTTLMFAAEGQLYAVADAGQIVPRLVAGRQAFCLTNPSLGYLVCFDREGEVTTSGEAIDWLTDRLPTRIRDEVRAAARIMGAAPTELDPAAARRLRRAAATTFSHGRRDWLWTELPADACAVRDPDAWRWVDKYVGHSETLMFFNESDDIAVFAFADGAQVAPVLGESFGFEFYLTNWALDYLLCFNHHDTLYAAGVAADWLRRKVEGNSPSPSNPDTPREAFLHRSQPVAPGDGDGVPRP